MPTFSLLAEFQSSVNRLNTAQNVFLFQNGTESLNDIHKLVQALWGLFFHIAQPIVPQEVVQRIQVRTLRELDHGTFQANHSSVKTPHEPINNFFGCVTRSSILHEPNMPQITPFGEITPHFCLQHIQVFILVYIGIPSILINKPKWANYLATKQPTPRHHFLFPIVTALLIFRRFDSGPDARILFIALRVQNPPFFVQKKVIFTKLWSTFSKPIRKCQPEFIILRSCDLNCFVCFEFFLIFAKLSR